MKKSVFVMSVILAGLVLLVGCTDENLAGEAGTAGKYYYICHATGSASNPYVGPIKIPAVQFEDPKKNGHYYHDQDYIVDKLIRTCPKTKPVCGDGKIDVGEECDGQLLCGCSECSADCKCIEPPVVKCANVAITLTLTNIQNTGDGNMEETLYLGSEKFTGTGGVFEIPLTDSKANLLTDPVISENTPGVSVQRLDDHSVRFLDYGTMAAGKEAVFWNIKIKGGSFSRWLNDFGTAAIGGKRNPLENALDGVWIYTPGQDEMIFGNTEVVVKQTTGPANDGFYLYWACEE